jgi:hypothetical protein
MTPTEAVYVDDPQIHAVRCGPGVEQLAAVHLAGHLDLDPLIPEDFAACPGGNATVHVRPVRVWPGNGAWRDFLEVNKGVSHALAPRLFRP